MTTLIIWSVGAILTALGLIIYFRKKELPLDIEQFIVCILFSAFWPIFWITVGAGRLLTRRKMKRDLARL